MSVVDRAIVKAYALRQNSAQPCANETAAPRSPDNLQLTQPDPGPLSELDSLSRILSSDDDLVTAAEWESLKSSLPTTVSPDAVAEVRAMGPSAKAETDAAQPPETFVFESAAVESFSVVPETPPVAREEAPRPLAASAAPHFGESSSAALHSEVAVATLPTPPVTEPLVYQAPVTPAELPWHWPEICEQLDQFTGDGFRQLAKHLQFAAGQGHKVLAFVGTAPNTGRTSVVLTLARILALEGRTQALLIDADRRHPELASLTKQPTSNGLCEVLHGQATLEQAAVRRTPGLVSQLPLRTPVSDLEWSKVVGPLRSLLKRARQEYELVLIDAGVFGLDTRLSDCWLRDSADAVITISRQLSGTKTTHDVLNWKQIGIESLGVIETFA